MSDFPFKVPKLPEDSLVGKEANGSCLGRKYYNENYGPSHLKSNYSSHISLLKNIDTDRNPLQSLGKDVEDNLAPSTSKYHHVCQKNNHSINSFQSSCLLCRNSTFEGNFNGSQKNFLCEGRDDTQFNRTAQQQSSRNFQLDFRNISTLNISSNNYRYAPVTRNMIRQDNHTTLNCGDRSIFFGRSNCQTLSNLESSCSSINRGKSIFGSGLLPECSRFQRNVSPNGYRNINVTKEAVFDSCNGTNVLQKNSSLISNASENISQHTITTLMMQVSVKEQVLNALEKFGSVLLRNAPDFSESFFGVTKEVKCIFENNANFLIPSLGSTSIIPAINSSSNATEALTVQRQSVLEDQMQVSKCNKDPLTIVKELNIKRREGVITKCETTKPPMTYNTTFYEERAKKASMSPKSSKKNSDVKNITKNNKNIRKDNQMKEEKVLKKKVDRSVLAEKKIKLSNKIIEQNKNVDDEPDRVLCVTRKGRVVKRPAEFWSSGVEQEKTPGNKDKSELNNCNESVRNQNKEPPRPKRKRDAHEKNGRDVKKSKSEKVKDGRIEGGAKPSPKSQKTKKKSRDANTSHLNNNISSTSEVSVKKGVQLKKSAEKVGQEPRKYTTEIEEGLDDIYVPVIKSPVKEKKKKNKMKLFTTETPPLKFLRSNLKLTSVTPDQSPNWRISQRTQSEVKKFEKFRTRTFKQKIPKENPTSPAKKKRNFANKDVETCVKWISERDVRSPNKCSKLLKYVMRKRKSAEYDDDNDNDCEGNETEEN